MENKLVVFMVLLFAARAHALVGPDPYYKRQTALQYMRVEQALPLLLDAKTSAHDPILIGVIDEGPINAQHPDMTGVLLPESDSTTQPSPNGHGQYVTGVLAALSHNGVGISGAIGSHARVLFKRVENVSDIINALNVFAARGVSVVNMSLGMDKPCSAIAEDGKCQVPIATNTDIAAAIENVMLKNNMIIVTSAGNEGLSVPRLAPANDGMLVVGSMDQSGRRASYSNFGPGVSLFAPDYGVWGLTFNGYSEAPAATSFTTPLVTAAAAWAALYLKAHGVSYTPKQIKSLLLKSVHQQSHLGGEGEVAGSIDYYNLAQQLQTLVASPHGSLASMSHR